MWLLAVCRDAALFRYFVASAVADQKQQLPFACKPRMTLKVGQPACSRARIRTPAQAPISFISGYMNSSAMLALSAVRRLIVMGRLAMCRKYLCRILLSSKYALFVPAYGT